MAKKGKKKSDKAADAGGAGKAGKLPKRIAGVKVPKHLREPGARIAEVLKHPLMADIAAAALVAAAASLRDNKSIRSVAAAAGDRGGKGAQGVSMIGAILAAKAADSMRRMAARDGSESGAGRNDDQRPRRDAAPDDDTLV